MTTRSTPATFAPHRFAFGQGVYLEDIAAVAEQSNYTGAENPVHLAGCASGPEGWSETGTAPEAHGVTSTASSVDWYVFQVYIPTDAITIHIGGRMNVPAGDTHDLTVDINGTSTAISFDNSGGGGAADVEATDTLATSSTGTGLQTVTLTTQRNSGSGTADVQSWYIRTLAIPDGSLPTPADE